MAFYIIANDAKRDAARMLVTNTSDGILSDTKIDNIASGPRHLYYQSADTGNRRLVYANTAGGIDADFVVWVRASDHSGRAVDLWKSSNYPSSKTTYYTTGSFAETTIGRFYTDWVYAVSVSNQDAVGLDLSSTYTKKVYKLYYGTAFQVSYMLPGLTIDRLPFGTRYTYRKQSYLVDYRITFVIDKLTAAQVESLRSLYNYREDPVFIYDSTGTVLYTKLAHVMIESINVVQVHDSFYQAEITALELRGYS